MKLKKRWQPQKLEKKTRQELEKEARRLEGLSERNKKHYKEEEVFAPTKPQNRTNAPVTAKRKSSAKKARGKTSGQSK